MDQYLKKLDRLKAGERNPSVVKSRSNSIEPRPREAKDIEVLSESANFGMVARENQAEFKNKKVAYQKDVVEVSLCVENVKNIVCALKETIEETNKELRNKIDELSKQIENVKLDTEQTKSERIKQKLDNFITNYNQNETAKSDVFKALETEIKNLSNRLGEIENVL